MTKRSLIPTAREIVLGPKADTTFFEVFHYPPDQDPALGHMFLVAQVLTDDEALSYVPNLLASFLKREYLESTTTNNDAHQTLERALRRTNELIYDLMENNNVGLNLAVAIINEDRLMASRVGRAKLLLARDDGASDVFSNTELFEKKSLDSHEFSSIISGKLLQKDKLFFFIPNRRLSARDSSIKASLSSMSQGEFAEYLESVTETANAAENIKTAFSCCGIHIVISQKEQEIVPDISLEQPAQLASAKHQTGSSSQIDSEDVTMPNRINPAEIDRVPKTAIVQTILNPLKKSLKTLHAMTPRKRKLFWGAGVLLAAVLIGGGQLIAYQNRKDNAAAKIISQTQELLKLAGAKVSIGENQEARRHLTNALSALEGLKDQEKRQKLTAEIESEFKKLDLTASNLPVILLETQNNLNGSQISTHRKELFLMRKNGDLELLDEKNKNLRAVLSLDTSRTFTEILTYDDTLYAKEDANVIWRILPSQNKTESITLPVLEAISDLRFYQDNLYILTSSITRINDFIKGQTKAQTWLNEPFNASPASMVVDQNIFVLSQNGQLGRYFKGEKIDERMLNFTFSGNGKLYSLGANFLLVDRNAKKARLFDSGGVLQRTWELSNVGEILDDSFDAGAKILYLLGPNRIASLEIAL